MEIVHIYRSVIRCLFLLFGVLFFLLSSMSEAQTWMFSNSCGWKDGTTFCANVRASSPGEYCKIVSQGTYENVTTGYDNPSVTELYGPLIKILVDIRPMGYVAGCVFRATQFNFSAIATSIPCRTGQYFDTAVMACVEKSHTNKCSAGNPVQIATGIKIQSETDSQFYLGQGKSFPLTRYYVSHIGALKNADEINFKKGFWRFKYTDFLQSAHYVLMWLGTETNLTQISTPEGTELFFSSLDGITWKNINDGQETLTKITEAGVTFWKLGLPDNSYKLFDLEGKLVRVVLYGGEALSLEYSTKFLGSINAVSNPRYVNLKYNGFTIYTYLYSHDFISQVTDFNFLVTKYSYDANGNMTNVLFPNATFRTYHYENPIFINSLTGITDENGSRFATWAYDSEGRAISSEHANGVDRTLLSFNADGSTTVTNSLNKKTTFRFEDTPGARHLVKVEGAPSDNCAGANQDYTYTAEGWVASKTDWGGNKTVFSYNAKGQEISRTEAYGSSVARTINTEWHPILNIKTKITEKDRETTFVYDANGLLMSQSTRALP